MGIFEGLKGIIADDIYEDSEELLRIYANIKFDYLGISLGSWEKLFVRKIKDIEAEGLINSEFSGELCRRINLAVKNYIRSELKKRDVRICNNLLIKFKRGYKFGIILRHYVYEFEQLEISFMDEVYDLLKEKSSSFRELLVYLGVSELSKEDFAQYLRKEYKIDTKANKKVTSLATPKKKFVSPSVPVKDTTSNGKVLKSTAYNELVRDKKAKNDTTIVSDGKLYHVSTVAGKVKSSFSAERKEAISLNIDDKNPSRNLSNDSSTRSFSAPSLASSKKRECTKENTSIALEHTTLSSSEQPNKKNIPTNDVIDNALMEKYSKLTLEEIKKLYGDSFHSLPSDSVQLLERFFSVPQNNFYLSDYEMEKTINLLLYGYKRKSTEIDSKVLLNVYLQNKDKFDEKEALYIECIIFNLQDKSIFEQKYQEVSSKQRSILINKLEMLYYGIEDLFDSSLTKEQYVSAMDKYPNEIEESMKAILDDYYGVNGTSLSLLEISKKYNMSYDETSYLIKKLKRFCLSLYSNLSASQKVDREIYMPYVLDGRYSLNKETREALTLYFEDVSYDEIEKRIGKKNAASIISKGIQKIDAYRFGVEKVKQQVEDETVEVEIEDIIAEIERHASESIITNEEKAFLSYLFGIKNNYNPKGEKLAGKELQERLGFKRWVGTKYKELNDRLRQRKLGNLEPEFIVMPREQLSQILLDPHLPISKEDRMIIGSLLEINGYPLKTLSELASELNITDKIARRKFHIAIININKYLIGEKEGIIDYETDIVPNLKYFTSKEREFIHDYYVEGLTNKEISKKYNLLIGKTTRLMYKIKATLNELVHNPNAKKFDYECYQEAIKCPNFPFRGDLEQAKKIFELYVGESCYGRTDTEEIRKLLGIDLHFQTITKIVESIVLSTFKYRDGIRKENTFSLNDILEFYHSNKDNLEVEELQLIEAFLNKGFGVDMKMSEDLIYLLLRNKYPDYLKLDVSKERAFEIFKRDYNQLNKTQKNVFMIYFGVRERDLMSKEEKYQVFMLFTNLDSLLQECQKQKQY